MSNGPAPIYQPNPAHQRTGTFAVAISGNNWNAQAREARYGRSWVTLPILQSAARTKSQGKRLWPNHWPIMFDYQVSDACIRIQTALRPPQRMVSGAAQRNALGVKQTDVIRACELAGFIQTMTQIENFVITFWAETRRVTDFEGDYLHTEPVGLTLTGLVPVASPPGQHLVTEHVLSLGEKLFYDMPRERSYLWDELATGTRLSEADRAELPWNKVVPPRLMNPDYAPFDPTKPVVQPPPNEVSEYVKNLPPDPGVDAALDRLKKVMGL